MSFPRSVGQLPLYYNYFKTGRPDPKNEVFWSHYIDEHNAPLFGFGHGLSYTQFKYSGLQLDSTQQGGMGVSVTVTNTGTVFGEEVVQLYIQDPAASVVRPIRELKGFSKIGLQPGESKQVQFRLTYESLGFYQPDGQYVVEPGSFRVMVGGSAQDGLKTTFTLDTNSSWAKWKTPAVRGF
jgi:beta-glucosidase